METLKDKAAKGFVWGALSNGATQLLNAIFGIVIARRLSEDDYGIIGLLTIFALIATSLQDSGFVTALTNKRDATHRDYNSVFWFNIGLGAIIYVIMFFCAPLISDFYDEPLLTDLSRYYFIAIFVASFSIVPRAILFRKLKQKELAIMGLLSLLISGTVGVTMAYNDMAYWGIATQTLTFNLCVVIFSWIISHWKPSFDITFQPVREMFAFSSKMLVTNIFNNINNNVFSVVLGKFYTKTEVGFYNQANKWNIMGASTITGMVQGVAQPTFVQVGDDKERLCRTFRKMLRFTCFVCFPVMFGLSLIAQEFIVILIKEKWLPSAHLMQMLCVGGAFLPIATLYFNLIISRGKSNIYMYNVISQGCLILATIVGVNYMFDNIDVDIMSYHLSLSNIDLMVLSYVSIIILWTCIWHFFLKREIGLSFVDAGKDILPFMLLAMATMIITYFITKPLDNIYVLLIARIITAAIIYVGALWILGAEILRECLGYVLKRK